MNQSLFFKWIRTRFESVVDAVVERINGSEAPVRYYHKEMLKKQFSPTLRWGSLSANGSIVAADVVAMDSTLPLKKRDSIAKVEGDIPKIGMMLALNERTMNDLIILEHMNGTEKEILKKLFADSGKVVQGVNEQNELMFLQGLSTGVALMEDEERPGLGIRVDYGHPNANKYGVTTPWSDTSAKPMDDIDHIMEEAGDNGHIPKFILMDKATWNKFKNNTQVKELVAASLLFTGSAIPTPNLKQVNSALEDSYSLTIEIIDRKVRIENNGVQKTVTPWAANKVVFLETMDVGTLTYGTLAEEAFPVKQVDYTKADDYILVSKYSTTNPVKEFTTSQALVVPVINNVHSIYIMDAEEASTDTQTEGDANFDYEGTAYTRTSVIAAINLANPDGPLATASNTDATLQKKINKLSDEQIETFEANITAA